MLTCPKFSFSFLPSRCHNFFLLWYSLNLDIYFFNNHRHKIWVLNMPLKINFLKNFYLLYPGNPFLLNGWISKKFLSQILIFFKTLSFSIKRKVHKQTQYRIKFLIDVKKILFTFITADVFHFHNIVMKWWVIYIESFIL